MHNDNENKNTIRFLVDNERESTLGKISTPAKRVEQSETGKRIEMFKEILNKQQMIEKLEVERQLLFKIQQEEIDNRHKLASLLADDLIGSGVDISNPVTYSGFMLKFWCRNADDHIHSVHGLFDVQIQQITTLQS